MVRRFLIAVRRYAAGRFTWRAAWILAEIR